MTTTNASISTPINTAQMPTISALLRSAAVATAVAVTLAVTCVLPAEYAVDPTGIGRLLGLQQMGEIKRDAAVKKATKADVIPAVLVRLAESSHIMNDAAPVGGSWAQLAQAAPSAAAPAAAAPTASAVKTDTLTIVLQPNTKMELKAWMKKGESYSYTWTASSPINFNFHGEKFVARDDEYTEYKKGVSTTEKGDFKAGYDGTHGWSWRNRTQQPITVTATITGSYDKFAEKK